MKKATFFILFLFPLFSFAQLGALEIELYIYEDELESSHTVYVYQGDKLIEKLPVGTYTASYDSLQPGKYEIVIKQWTKERYRISNIEVKDGQVCHVNQYFEEPYHSDPCDETEPFWGEAYLNFLYGDKSFADEHFINASYKLSAGTRLFPLVRKHFAVGYNFAIFSSYTDFRDDTTFFPPGPRDNEHYFSLGYEFGVLARFTSFDYTQSGMNGLYTDIGINYRLPFCFRHTYTEGNKKILYRRIHQFKDLSARLNVGYKPVALTAEYRILDFVRDEFPEEPRWQLGILFRIGE